MRLFDRFRRSSLALTDLLQAELLVPIPDTGTAPREAFVLEEAEVFEFVAVRDDDGRSVLPAFTSEAALVRWAPQGSPYLGLAGGALLEVFTKSDWDLVVVDGADSHALTITRAAAVELLRREPPPH